jgi:hypothetical protein
MGTQDEQQKAPSTVGCGTCDAGDLACSTERFKRQAVVAEESATALAGLPEKYNQALAAYTEARASVQVDVKAAKDLLKHLRESLKCLLDDEERRCLKESFRKIIAAIDDCKGGDNGCCVGNCDFDGTPATDESASGLSGRIDQYRRDTQQNIDCFNKLIGQQQEVPAEVAAIKSEVAAIDAAARAEGDKDVPRLYARVLVARSRLDTERLWRGFTTVGDYMDCLCKALTCSYKGWEAIILLEGAKAEKDCQDTAKVTACTKLQTDILENLMCEYDKCRPKGSSGDSDEDCGCGHHGSSDTSAQSSPTPRG